MQVPESRAVKRRPIQVAVPASSACSEGGRSDSSAKSAPGPPQHLHQHHWHTLQQHHQGPSMLAAALGPPGCTRQGAAAPQQQQPAAPAAAGLGGPAVSAAGDIHPGALAPLGPMAGGMNMNNMMPNSFPLGSCMMGGMMGGPPAGCMPFMPPWAMMPPGMMQHMMFGGLPMPPLPMPPAGLMPMPFMPGMGPGMTAQGMGLQHAAMTAAEPAAGIPVTGPLPPAGNTFKVAAGLAATAAPGSSSARTNTAAGSKPGGAAQNAPTTPAAAAAAVAAPARPAVQQLAPVVSSPAAASPSPCPSPPAGGCAGMAPGASSDVMTVLEQLDLVAVRSWVCAHFCEEVYLMLLDAWRPDSSKVREAIWAWKLHVRGPRPDGAEPDYRAFLVSLFGLDKLTQLTAASGATRQGSAVLVKTASCPATAASLLTPAGAAGNATAQLAAAAGAAHKANLAAAAAAAGAMTPDREAPSAANYDAAGTTSNLSSEPAAATLTTVGPAVMKVLLPGSNVGTSATSPHRAGPVVPLQLP